MEKFLVAIATSLTSTLMVAAGRLIRDEAIGDDQERGLADIFKAATSVVLVEAVRQDRNDRDLPDRLETEFGRFYGDRWVAETLVRVALSAEPPPFDKLCRRYNELGNDSTDLPIDFEDAMRLLVKELADRLRKEASRAGSPLTNLVVVSDLGVLRKNSERELERRNEAAPVSAMPPDKRDDRFEEYERGPEDAIHDLLFAGIFLPSGPEGRLTSGGASRAFEQLFLEVFRRELDGHYVNNANLEIMGTPVSMHLLDYRPTPDYVDLHDYESFSEFTGGLTEHALGIIWGTVSEGGGLQTLEVVANPDQFYGGYEALAIFTGVKRLADREDLPARARIVFAAQALAAIWANSLCAVLDGQGMHSEAYMVASDSRRLVERALESLEQSLGDIERATVEEQRRGLLPQIVRQEASSLWRRGAKREALTRLLDALKIWPYAPFSGRGEFREYIESAHAFSLAHRSEEWEQRLAENVKNKPGLRRSRAWQYAERARIGVPSPNLPLFLDWIGEELQRGIDLEEEVEHWFAELAGCYPEDAFVVTPWGEARRLVAVHKYGAGAGSPTAWRLDRAAEKFETAYRMAPDVPYFAARVHGIKFTAAITLASTEDGERRLAEQAEWWEKAKPYYREHAPWALEPEPEDESETPGR
jgi:hypothetical protein